MNKPQIAAILNARLADTTDLRSQVKQAHWNLRSPQFIALHELFDAIALRLDAHIDDLAERTVQLGTPAKGTARQAVAASTLPEPPASPDWLDFLIAQLTTHAANVRAAIDQTATLGDAGTSDLLTGMVRELDKDVWFLDAHRVG
jgi:starvation-inducible DNA-binding protein